MIKKIGFMIIIFCMLSCANINIPSKNGTVKYDDLPIYSGTFEGYMYFENYQNSLYLVQEIYFDDYQPYIINESEFYRLLDKNLSSVAQEINIPDIQLENYISDFTLLENKNRYRIVYSIYIQTNAEFRKLKDSVSNFKFEIAFSDGSSATEKNEYIQKLDKPVVFKLLNEGNEIVIQ